MMEFTTTTQTQINKMEPLWLPPGFRFHPLDDELVEAYLTPKVKDSNFTVRHIGEVDLNRCEPWDLPGMAKIGEKEWYFYAVRDRKYPTGMRTNRATDAGYWKATGKDKEVMSSRSSHLLGMKKTLVFYKGRAPRGEKTNWIMHEYRLESDCHIAKVPKDSEWVVCRIFKKTPGGKKAHIKDIQQSTFYNGSSEALMNALPPLESPHLIASKDPGFDSDVSGQNDHVTEFGSQGYQSTVYNGFRSNQSEVWDPSIHGIHSVSGPIPPTASVSDIVSMFNFNSSYQDMYNSDQPFSEASASVNSSGKLRQGASALPPLFRSNLFATSSSKGSDDQLSKAFVDYYVCTNSRPSPLRQCKVEPQDVGVSENALESSQKMADNSLLISDNACYEANKDLSVAESFPHSLFRSSTSIVDIDGFSWTY